MASHGVWNGSISFGLVTIPVSLQTAVEDHDLKLSMLDRRDLAPIGYQHINKKSGKEVEWADIVKGYEYEDNKYVVLEPEDFEKANVKANQLLEIEDFVNLDEVDPTFLEKPYYIVPTAQGLKAYNLLRDALARSNKIGIGRVVLHTKYRLVAIIPMDKVLILEILRFGHELRPVSKLAFPKSARGDKVDSREVAMAEQLIAGLTSHWDPSKYKDTYHDDLLRLIDKKIERGATAEVEPYNAPAEDVVNRKGKVLDLMPLLQASLEKRRGPSPAARRTRAKTTSRSTAKSTRSRATARRSR